MSERFMLMEHTKNNFVVTIWSDGSMRIETTYKVRVNIGHFFHTYLNFDCEKTTFPRYAEDMVHGVISEYLDWKVACDESLQEIKTVCIVSCKCWSIEFFSDDTVWVQSTYKVRQNIGWFLGKTSEKPRKMPNYVWKFMTEQINWKGV